ncbi:DUF305 domain-containing protein [Wangella sp. NEAU-J3]|nr:DUF305 domain-containing protein [Jidongwangia harbinensis]
MSHAEVHHSPFLSRIARLTTTAVALALVGACGGTGHGGADGDHGAAAAPAAAASTPPGSQHNQADITFAQAMIPHHQQALEMAAAAETKATDPKVKALATRIKGAQEPEIDEMTSWLSDWAAPGASMPAGESHGDMGGTGPMPGMMTADEMAAFTAATGADFDRMFLEMMIRHHQGAITMAAAQRQQGLNPSAKALAEAVEREQAAEITQMRSLLGAK